MPQPARIDWVDGGNPDLGSIVDRVLVFDGLLSPTQLVLLCRWALTTPHWMLTNSAYDEAGQAQHRIWGASYIQPWKQQGWPGLPPVLFSTIACACQQLDVHFTEPGYIGLNGQSRGQQASVHVDCARDAADQLSMLIYIGEDTDGDLVLYDKNSRTREVQRVQYRPNRIVVFDGSIPHQALAPCDDRFRMSIIVRGTYQCGSNGWKGAAR
jgi:hypothetical protein